MSTDLRVKLTERISYYREKFEETTDSNDRKKEIAGEKFSRLCEIKSDLLESEHLVEFLKNLLED
ncbi:MAG: hypothetical protein M1431_02955 [Candidatus Thermoplasmatota archaeon]|jgi:hypothetical protein|nr:hypothetical protein [Candidatus Thermoplasmatota archaeon]